MKERSHISFKALKVSQPIGDFFVSKIPSNVITKCSSADMRRFSSIETVTMFGFKKIFDTKIVNEMFENLTTTDASVPNSIILNLNSYYCSHIKQIYENDEFYEITIEITDNTFSIIDGHYKLLAIEKLIKDDKLKKFDIIVTIYCDLPIPDQAYLFSMINSKQKNVNESLVYDLFELSKTRSPDLSAHMITKALNGIEESPFFKKITLLGNTQKYQGEILNRPILTHNIVANCIYSLISKKSDIVHSKLQNKLSEWSSLIEEKNIFYEYYKNNEDDVILKILLNYFNSVKNVFLEDWENQDNLISSSIGFTAFMKYLVRIFNVGYNQDDLSYEFFYGIMKIVGEGYRTEMSNFNHYQSSDVGAIKLYEDLVRWSKNE